MQFLLSEKEYTELRDRAALDDGKLVGATERLIFERSYLLNEIKNLRVRLRNHLINTHNPNPWRMVDCECSICKQIRRLDDEIERDFVVGVSSGAPDNLDV